MAIDFSWLITAFNNIAININNFFSGIWSSVTQITNTGQGLFGGLVSFGGWIYQGLKDAYYSLQIGITAVGDAFRLGIETFANQFLLGFQTLATDLFSVGQWIWAGIQGFANMVANAVIYIQNATWTFVVDSWNTLYSNIVLYKTSVDTWFAQMIIAFRAKLTQSIIFSVSADIAWKSAQRIPEARSLTDLSYGLLGVLVAPIPAYLMATIITGLVPTPTSTTYKVTPDFSGIALISPTLNPYAPMPPTPATPTELVVGVGVVGNFRGITMTEKNFAIANPLSITATAETIGEKAIAIVVDVAFSYVGI